jgi:carboxyl-terminal processing protease
MRAASLLEQAALMEAAERTGGLSAKDDVVKFKDKKIEELNEKIRQMEAEAAKGGGGMPPGMPLLKEIEDKIGKYYVDEKKASINQLTEDAAKGMVDALDPFSSYMSEKETTSFQESMRQEYAGIGAVVQINAKTGFLNIVRPIYGGPAYKAGLRTLDQIVEVEGQPTNNKKLFATVNDLVAKLKGRRHTKVKIKVKHFLDGPDAAPVDLEIKRDFIMLQSVRYDMLPGKIGYLQLESFGAKASEEIESALTELEKQGMRALVFDLRGNPGGYLNQAVEICSKFLAKGKLVVYQQGREGTEIGKRKDFHVSGDEQHPDYPLVILIDENAASASEIVSGALQVHKRADLVGHQTFGKGSVQQIFPVNATDGKAALRLTIAYYYLPDGRCIHRPRKPQQWRYQELIRSEIERWKMEGNISDAQAKILLDQYKQKPGGVVPDFDVKIDVLSADVLKKMALIADAGKFDEYIQKHWKKDTKTFLELVESDAFDHARYPGFDEWYADLKTDLSKDDVRKFLRVRVRMFAQDELAKILPSDFQEDNQLDAAVWVAYQKLGEDVGKVKGLEFIAKKFPKGIERNASVAIGKKGPPTSADEEDDETETPEKKDEKKAPEKKDDKKPEKKEDF